MTRLNNFQTRARAHDDDAFDSKVRGEVLLSRDVAAALNGSGRTLLSGAIDRDDVDNDDNDNDDNARVTTARNVAAGLLLRRKVDESDARVRRVLSFRAFAVNALDEAIDAVTATTNVFAPFLRHSDSLAALARVGIAVS